MGARGGDREIGGRGWDALDAQGRRLHGSHLFLAEGLTRLPLPPDDTEFIEVRSIPFQEALRLVLSGEVQDSMTIIAVLLAARRRAG